MVALLSFDTVLLAITQEAVIFLGNKLSRVASFLDFFLLWFQLIYLNFLFFLNRRWLHLLLLYWQGIYLYVVVFSYSLLLLRVEINVSIPIKICWSLLLYVEIIVFIFIDGCQLRFTA